LGVPAREEIDYCHVVNILIQIGSESLASFVLVESAVKAVFRVRDVRSRIKGAQHRMKFSACSRE
jgi:hypothetical protein